MNTFIKNMLLFIGKIKRSKSKGESEGEKQRFWKNMSLTRFESAAGQWGRRRGEEGESKLSGGDEIGKSGVTRACLFPI